MTARTILQAFSQYQQARTAFVQTIANLAARPQNAESLESAGVLDLLSPLLSDVIPSIQQKAAIALGRLAEHDARIAQAIVRRDIVSRLLKNIEKQNKYYKKAALLVLRAVAKHSPEMATVIVSNGGLEAMICCLEDFDYGVKEAAAWAIASIARHKESLARAIVNEGVVPLLVLCLQEPELCLKQISASALCDISKHSADLAQTLVDAGAVPFLVKAISNPDAKLKSQVFGALGSIAKHSIELAEVVVEAEIFPEILIHMGHPDENVNRTAAIITREVCKHTLQLAELVVNTGGIGALVELIDGSKSSARLPAIMALGYIAGHSDQLAMAVIGSKGIVHLAVVLQEETEDHILAISAWAIGQIGKHSPEHAKTVAAANLLHKLLEMYKNEKNSEDLRSKSKSSLKQILQKCMHIDALEPLLCAAPANILKYVLGQFSKILPNDPRSRRLFVTMGGLKKVQEIQAETDTKLAEYIQIINRCFPEEVVRYYSPGYPDSLLESIEQYEPRRPSDIGWDQIPSSEPSDSSLSLSHGEDD